MYLIAGVPVQGVPGVPVTDSQTWKGGEECANPCSGQKCDEVANNIFYICIVTMIKNTLVFNRLQKLANLALLKVSGRQRVPS